MTTVLVIAGTDSSGGAGLARDLRTLAELHTRAVCAVTAVTAQSDAGALGIHVVPAAMVRAQIEAAFATCRIDAVKIGMLATAATVEAVQEALRAHASVPVVLDPVLASSSGAALLDDPGQEALRGLLLPRVTLLTPNIPEAGLLLGTSAASSEAQMLSQAHALLGLGARAILIKGGHGAGREAVDLLVRAQGVERLAGARVDASCRGTGCALASAVAAALAAGCALDTACMRAKDYVTALLRSSAHEPH
jgi:hydroxymethylpyrimidine/phosphomethylpyrimidine kinase